MLLYYHALFFSLGIYVKENKADDGIDLNLFHQHDYQVKFERVELAYFNKSFGSMSIVTFKYNRTLAVANATFTPKMDMDNDLVGIIQVYKFMSNEYRYFPIHFAINSCKALVADVFGMSGFMNCGNFSGCPLHKGITQHICNWYPNPANLPPLIPNGQYKIEVKQMWGSHEVAVGNVYGTVDRPIVYNNATPRKG